MFLSSRGPTFTRLCAAAGLNANHYGLVVGAIPPVPPLFFDGDAGSLPAVRPRACVTNNQPTTKRSDRCQPPCDDVSPTNRDNMRPVQSVRA